MIQWTDIQNWDRPTDIENNMIAKGERVEGSIGSLGLKYTHYYV